MGLQWGVVSQAMGWPEGCAALPGLRPACRTQCDFLRSEARQSCTGGQRERATCLKRIDVELWVTGGRSRLLASERGTGGVPSAWFESRFAANGNRSGGSMGGQ